MRAMLMLLTVLTVSAVPAHAGKFVLTSPQLKDGGTLPEEQVFNGSGCHGGNVSPALAWHSPPPGTKSYAVTVYDPDAPTGRGWWHWIIFNIPPSAAGLSKDAGNPSRVKAPAGSVQIRNDFGKPGYGGACPPAGAPHRYVFTVYALNTEKLPLKADASAEKVLSSLKSAKISSASLTASYGR